MIGMGVVFGFVWSIRSTEREFLSHQGILGIPLITLLLHFSIHKTGRDSVGGGGRCGESEPHSAPDLPRLVLQAWCRRGGVEVRRGGQKQQSVAVLFNPEAKKGLGTMRRDLGSGWPRPELGSLFLNIVSPVWGAPVWS